MSSTEQLRIAVTSDLHWEIGRTALERRAFASELAIAMADADPDVVVIAGDVGNGPRSAGEALGYLSFGRRANLFVPGNHDVWLTDRELEDGIDSSFQALDALREACAATGFRYLPGDPVVVGGVGFAGSLGWYDYAFRSPEVPVGYDTYRSKRWRGSFNQDGWFAAWREGDRRLPDEEVAAGFEAALAEDLGRLGLGADGAGPTTVAVTRMLPYRELVHYRGPADWTWDFMSAFMGSPGLGPPRLQSSPSSEPHPSNGHLIVPVRRMGI